MNNRMLNLLYYGIIVLCYTTCNYSIILPTLLYHLYY